MVIFHSYVKLPEGITWYNSCKWMDIWKTNSIESIDVYSINGCDVMLVWVEVTNQLGISQPWPLRPQFVLSFQGLVRFLSRELSVCSGGFPSCCRCCCSGRPLIFWCLRHVWLSKDMEKRSTDLTALIWASLNPVRHRNFMSFVSLVLLVHRRTWSKFTVKICQNGRIPWRNLCYWWFPSLFPWLFHGYHHDS